MTNHINPGTDTTINPLRCKTCGHYKEGKYVDTCKNIPFPDHMDSAERQYIKDWIKEHGCATHTSATTPAHPPEAQQRIDVLEILDEVEQFIKKEAKLTMLQWNDVEVYFQKKRALLQAGDRK